MDTPPPAQPQPSPAPVPSVITPKRSGRRIFLMVLGMFLLGCGVTAAAVGWWVKRNIYASSMNPVHLNATEQKALDVKLQNLQHPSPPPTTAPGKGATDDLSSRTLVLTQKEINAYIAQQNLGDRLRIDLGEGNVKATVIVPVPKDAGIPLVSGTTLRLSMSVDAVMDAQNRVDIKLADVRLGGISLPNAWLGNLKGVNLVEDSLNSDPALRQFLSGIKEIEIQPEGLRILLNK